MAGLVAPSRVGHGVMRIISNSELDKQDADAQKQNKESENREQVLNSLATHINRQWQAAYAAKRTIETRMIKALRQRNGVYDPAKLAQIKEYGGSEIFMMLTSIKCRAAESWINDILFQTGDKFWSIKPTPIPDLPPQVSAEIEANVNEQAQAAQAYAEQNGQPPLTENDIAQRLEAIEKEFKTALKEEADKLASGMEIKMEDQLLEGEWRRAIKEFIKDVVTYPAGVLKGPVITRKRTLKYQRVNGKMMPIIGSKLGLKFYRVSPFDYYPSPNARNTNDGFQIERHRLRRKDLLAMKGVPGYNDAAIDAVLLDYGIGGLRQWLFSDTMRANLEGRPNEWLSGDETIDALEYYGSVPGQLLRQWGMSEKQIPDKMQEYEANVWLIGSHIIRATLNSDPLSRRPYHTASLEEIPGAIWGYGAPEIMEDDQDVCNATGRALINNMAIASGPMAEVHSDRLAPGEEVTQMSPWRIFQTQSDVNGTNNPAIRFHNPKSNAKELLNVYDHFSKLADEHTGIPAYTYGNPDVGGAAKTASGLSMLMSSASRGIKEVIAHIDDATESCLSLVYEHNMLYDQDESIKGDSQVVARGSSSMMAKEQKTIRVNELLNTTNNPVDMNIIRDRGRANLLREAMDTLDMSIDDIVPDDKELADRIRTEATQSIQPGTRATDAAGNPAAGQDNALFNGRG